MSKFKRNQAAFDAFRKNTPYRDTPFEASTGKLNSDGTINPNPAVGLDEGYVWVRREGDRAETRALAGKVRTDIANIPVVVAQDNLTGELTVMDVLASAAVERFGGAWARSMYAQPIGEAFRTTIYGRNLIPGRVKVWIKGTLQVNAEEFWYNNTAQARVLWEPDNANVLDLSSNVPATDGGYNQQRWVVIALNPNAATPALVAFNGTAIKTGGGLLKASIKDIAVTDGYTKLAAVQLRTGDTTEADITDDEWEDLRPWVVNVDYSAITGAVITNSTIDSSVIGGTTPAAITGNVITSAAGEINISSAAGTARTLFFQTSGSSRWQWQVSTTAESAGNVGSNISLGRFDNSGNFLGPVLSFIRATGVAAFITDDSVNSSVTQGFTINHTTTGTPADGIGAAFGFGVETSGVGAGTKQVGSIQALWPTSLDSGRLGRLRFMVNDFNTAREAMAINTDGTAPLISVSGVTTISSNDTTAGAPINVMVLSHNTSGTPATGLGTGVMFQSETSTTPDTNLASIQASWATVTHASRKGKVIFSVYDTAAREAIAIEASGSAAMIGFLGAAAVARPAAYTQTYATATRTRNAYTPDDESAAYTGIDNAQAGTVYATAADLNALRTAYENLRAAVENDMQVGNQIIDDQQANGLFA